MFKWSTALKSFVLVISAATSVAHASDGVAKDPRGLFRVSSNLLLAGDADNGEQQHAPRQGSWLEDDDPSKPSNTNAPGEVLAAPGRAAALRLTDAQEKEARKYVFGDEDLTAGDLQSRLIARPLLTMLQTLQGGIAKTPAEMSKTVKTAGTPVHKLCYRYKDRGFLTHDNHTGQYRSTFLGQRVLELLEANYKPTADKQKKRSRSEDENDEGDDEDEFDDDADSSEKEVVKPAAPKKTKTSSSILPGQMKKPELHQAILEALQDGEATFANIQASLIEAGQQNKHLDMHLKTQMGYGWVTRGSDEDETVYKLTKKGKESLKALAEKYGEDEEEEVLSSTKKRQRKPVSTETNKSVEEILAKLARPELHCAILNAMGEEGEYKNVAALIKSLQVSNALTVPANNFKSYYLAGHVDRGWLETIKVDDDKEYGITHLGVKIRNELLRRAADDDEVEDNEQDESSSNSSSVAKKKRKSRGHGESDLDDDEGLEDDQDGPAQLAKAPRASSKAPSAFKTSNVPAKTPAKVGVQGQAKAAALPESDQSKKTKHRFHIGKNAAAPKPAAEKGAVINPLQGHLPRPVIEQIWGEWGEDADQDTLRLIGYPAPLQKHLLKETQDSLAGLIGDAAFVSELRRVALLELYHRLGSKFSEAFGLLPEYALNDFLRQNVTFTITSNNNNK
jgi:DNA-binding HxlR family transcriptional regulator